MSILLAVGSSSRTRRGARWGREAESLRRVLLHSLTLALFALLALSQAPQVVLHPSGIVIPDLIDPVHHIWSVAILLRDVRTWPDGLWSLFDANIFYPVRHAAAFADTFVGLLPFLLPLSALTQDPAVLANLLLVLSFVLSAYGAFLLGMELTASYPAALVCGLTFGFCPLHIEQVGHVTLASMQWQAFAAWCLVRAWRRGAWHWWILAGLFLGLSAITNLYYLAYLTGPLVLAAATLGRAWTWRRIQGAAISGTLALLIALPMIIPYLTRKAVVGPGYGASSTDVLSFVSAMAGRAVDSLVLPAVPFQVMQQAHGLFPGFAVLILAWLGWRRGGIRPWGIYALSCLVLALGPQLLIAGRLLPLPLPYAILSAVVPHFALFRDPTRATAGLALGLAVAAAWGAHALLLKVSRKRLCLAVLLIVAIGVESWTPLPTARLASIPAGAYWLARQPNIHTVVVLPIANNTPLDWERQTEIMRESTVNWKWMVNGSESLDPVGMAERRKVLATYPSPASLRMLHSLRVDAVVLRLDWLTPRQRTAMQSHCDVGYHDAVETICLQDRTARALALRAP